MSSNPYAGLSDERRQELMEESERYFNAVMEEDESTLRDLWERAEREPDWKRVLVSNAAAWFGKDD